jgi:hypothetical protein
MKIYCFSCEEDYAISLDKLPPACPKCDADQDNLVEVCSFCGTPKDMDTPPGCIYCKVESLSLHP